MNKINLLLLISLLLAIVATGWFYHQINNRVGDISYNKELDDPQFSLCSTKYVLQEYNSHGVDYNGGERAIKKQILEELAHEKMHFEGSGLITFRFVVNCKGETGLFRVKSVNEDLEETRFDPEEIEKLQAAIAKLDQWEPGEWEDEKLTSYAQIHFKIEEGKITDIF